MMVQWCNFLSVFRVEKINIYNSVREVCLRGLMYLSAPTAPLHHFDLSIYNAKIYKWCNFGANKDALHHRRPDEDKTTHESLFIQ
jgi:hypothetical protein